jgi:hypothetical protein
MLMHLFAIFLSSFGNFDQHEYCDFEYLLIEYLYVAENSLSVFRLLDKLLTLVVTTCVVVNNDVNYDGKLSLITFFDRTNYINELWTFLIVTKSLVIY